jgi:hypothetical protein
MFSRTLQEGWTTSINACTMVSNRVSRSQKGRSWRKTVLFADQAAESMPGEGTGLTLNVPKVFRIEQCNPKMDAAVSAPFSMNA